MTSIFGNFLPVALKMQEAQKLYRLAKDEGFDETFTPISSETTITDLKNEKTENSRRSNFRKYCSSKLNHLNF